MMTSGEFVRAWQADASTYDEGLITAAPAALAELAIPPAAKTFLSVAGLPDSAAPFLSFNQLAAVPLPTLAEAWNLPYNETARHIYCIGSSGSGDPVGISSDGRVWIFNHDNGFEPTFVNASIMQLAACLVAYRQLVAETVRTTGSYLDASIDGKVPARLIARFQAELQQIDPEAYAGVQDEQGRLLPSMWQQELRELRGA